MRVRGEGKMVEKVEEVGMRGEGKMEGGGGGGESERGREDGGEGGGRS